MLAVRFHAHGGPDVLRCETAPDPQPGPGEALVRVRACALNHLDLQTRRGTAGTPLRFPHISGSDVSGEIAAGDTGGLEIGRRVMLQPGLACGHCEACSSREDHRCAEYGVLGYQRDGGYAELVKVPLENLIPLPDNVGFVEAAAFPLTFLTAWHMLVTRAHLTPGEDVLVLAAGSGLGQAAVQLAKALGARVFTTVGSDDRVERARALGAHAVIHHYRHDFAEEVLRLTLNRGVDVVVEHVGEATWERSVRCLARGGRLVTCGSTSGPLAALHLPSLVNRQLSILGSYMAAKSELLRVAPWFFDGRLAPEIDSTFPLAEAAAAQQRLEAGQHFGKIVLEC